MFGPSLVTGLEEMAGSDGHASMLLSKAKEGAELYLLVTNRQKGCDGMGERAMVTEEFREAIDALINYCKGKRFCFAEGENDLGSAARELLGGRGNSF